MNEKDDYFTSALKEILLGLHPEKRKMLLKFMSALLYNHSSVLANSYYKVMFAEMAIQRSKEAGDERELNKAIDKLAIISGQLKDRTSVVMENREKLAIMFNDPRLDIDT